LGVIPWSPELLPPATLGAGDTSLPLVYVTLGSSGDQSALSAVLAGLEKLPLRGLLATAGRPAPRGLPASFTHADYVPGDLVARQSRFVITNGGSSTGYQALMAGVPVLGIPSNLDQYLAMQAITRAGVGLELRSAGLKPEQVRRAAQQLCDDTELQRRARELGARLRAHDCHAHFGAYLRGARGAAAAATARQEETWSSRT
jgi:UDP:flavonoid glycosyltransferase YjiC (YdhE family)